jgi:PAS domain S-box-containing protein
MTSSSSQPPPHAPAPDSHGADVDPREQIERTLHMEKLFSDAMTESMPGILYFYDASGRFLRWNRNFETVSGYTADEIWNMHPLEFFAGADKERVATAIARVFTDGEATVEASFIAKDGQQTPYFFTGRRIEFEGRPCLIGVGIDISARVRTEKLLQASERKYRELVENANSIILRWSSDGRIMFLNEFGLRFFGYSSEEIVGRHVLGTLVPDTDSSGSDLGDLMERICASPEDFAQNTNENMRRNGERVWISWTNRIERDENGRVIGILSIGNDITDRLRIEAEREQRMRAEEADRVKSAFLATMSHELRTPLNSIIGFTGILLQGLAGPLNDEQNKQLGMVRTSARHLLALVNDVLDISKIEAGQLEIVAQPYDVRRSIEKVLALVRPQVSSKGLDLRVDIDASLQRAVGDERRFEQILLNLLSNAIKFTDRGEVRVSAQRLETAPVQGGGPAMRLQICDTGIGIRPEDLQVLFQPFQQLESGLDRKHEGTGLGLAISRRLAELLGGEISAASEWGKGSTFTVVLPLDGNRTA